MTKPKSRAPSPAPQPKAPPQATRKRVFLVDDHPMMRVGLGHLIERQSDLTMCGEAANPAEALKALPGAQPDIILADLTMPGRSGLEFVKDLLALSPDLAILIVSMHDEAVYAERALRAGARGYIMKEAGGEAVVAAIRQILAGQAYVSPAMSARLLDNLSGRKPRGSSSPIEKLSDREFEVFQLIGQGKSTRDIATQLHLSSKTVDVHRSHIKEKLELNDVTALIRYAVRWVETQKTDQ